MSETVPATRLKSSSGGRRRRPRSGVPSKKTCFAAGIFSGSVQAAVFSPWDRALYLSILHRRSFLSAENFKAPFEGFHQSVIHRVITGSLYFPLEEIARRTLKENNASSPTSTVFAGVFASLPNAILTNPLSAVKHQSWGTVHRGSMLKSARHVIKKSGFKSLFTGMQATLCRDVTWGGTYALLRHSLPRLLSSDRAIDRQPSTLQFSCNMCAALLATVLSSPFNFARNIQYGTLTDRKGPTRMHSLIRGVWREAAASNGSSLAYILRRMNVGWGTLRVAVSMGVGSQLYDYYIYSSQGCDYVNDDEEDDE